MVRLALRAPDAEERAAARERELVTVENERRRQAYLQRRYVDGLKIVTLALGISDAVRRSAASLFNHDPAGHERAKGQFTRGEIDRDSSHRPESDPAFSCCFGWRMDATANGEVEMELKMEELNIEPRELTLDELDNASGGVIAFPLMLGIAVVGSAFCLGVWLRTKLF
jgi:hypothetical protein